MDELSLAVENLKLEDVNAIGSNLTVILNKINEEFSEDDKKGEVCVNFLLKHGLLDSLMIICSKDLSTECHASSMEILSKVAKTDAGRECCNSEVWISTVLNAFEQNDDVLLRSAFKALANICYENDEARAFIKQKDFIGRLIRLLKTRIGENSLPEELSSVSAGCLLNLTGCYVDLQKEALEAGLFELILMYLEHFSGDVDTVTFCVYNLACLQSEHDSVASAILEGETLTSLLNLCEPTATNNIIDSLIEIADALQTDGSMKFRLATMGYCNKLLAIIRHRSIHEGDNLPIVRKACRSFSSIFSDDASAEFLYQHGRSPIYRECISWLDSDIDMLYTHSVWLLGNFARCDENCVQMVKDDVARRMLPLLRRHSTMAGDITIQHVVLSAFKNLAIPDENKLHMVEIGALNIFVSMATVEKIETYPVISRLIGCMRMIAMSQDVVQSMGENDKLMVRLVHWANIKDHPPVQSAEQEMPDWNPRTTHWREATRLLARIFECCNDVDMQEKLVVMGALIPIMSMLHSEYDLMKIEALNAVQAGATQFIDYIEFNIDKGKLVTTVIANLKGEPKLIKATLSLVEKLMRSGRIKTSLNTTDFQEELQAVSEMNISDEIKSFAHRVLKSLK